MMMASIRTAPPLLRVIAALLMCISVNAVVTRSGAASSTKADDYARQHVFLAIPETEPTVEPETFLDHYENGVRAYLANDWSACVDYLTSAIAGYRDFYAATASCRLRCKQIAAAAGPFYEDDADGLQHYESLVRRTLCLVKCKQMFLPTFDEFFEMNDWIQEVFSSRKPYTYLQLCYYRSADDLNAAHATFTVLLHHPDDEMMAKNLHFYLTKLNADGAQLVDLEQKRFAQFYLDALMAYDAQNYALVIEKMEASVTMFTYELDECRAFCEGDYEQGWKPDFVTATANHFTYNLRCKQNCTDDLANIRGKHYDNIFASHYEYLHISYYNVNKTNKACQAAASFLYIVPDAQQMQENLAFYQQGKLAACKPRKESILFGDTQRYEQRLMRFIAEEFNESAVKIPAWKMQKLRHNSAYADKILVQHH